MQSLSFAGLILIDEKRDISGRPIWLSAVNRASKLGFQTRVLLFSETENDIVPHLSNHQNVAFIDCLDGDSDPLSMIQTEADGLAGQSRSLLVVDTATPLIRQFGTNKVSAALYYASQSCPLLTRFRRDIVPEVEAARLRGLATTLLTLNADADTGKQLCTTLTFKKAAPATIREKVESYTIDPETTNIVSHAFEAKPSVAPTATGNDFLGCAAVNRPSASGTAAGNTRAQREKASVVLPFTRAQTEQGLVGLNANTRRKPLGAKIEYFADKDDDLDDSDPDDDLMY
uniref:Elongator complex protein 5 n=1 Tax=Panagrellus redivivus TaxID=6233 RepID=A0A7E4W2U5_PANRE